LEQLRKCIACGQLKPRSELIRITKEHASGDIIVQPNSKVFGRSAYLCYNQECINEALKKKKLNKALRTSADLKGLLDGQLKS